MKSTKFIVGALAGAALLLASCQEEFTAGEDQSRLVPSDLRYDTENSTADNLAFCWSAGQTIAAGATSYSIEVCDNPDDAVNMYDDVIQTIKTSAVGSDGVARATFTKGISEYTEKYVRLRVNYGAVFSSWTFAKDSEGNPAVFVAGHGIKDLKKPSVESISVNCPEDASEFSVKADLSAVASASRVLVLLLDYTSQQVLDKEVVDPSSKSTFEKTYTDLRSGKLYQVKMLPEYDVTGEATHVAEWTVAEGDATDEAGETVKSGVIQCGKGFVVINGVPPTTRLAAKYSGMLVFEWTESGFLNPTKDVAIPVKVALYKDADCKDLLYGWTIKSDIFLGRQPIMSFANLTPSTKYWFTCQDLNSGLLSDPLEVETAAFDIVTVGANKVAAGETALAEDFGELYFGSNSVDVTPSAKNTNNGYSHPIEGEWDNCDLAADSFNHGFFNTLGSSGGVQSSRFKDWAVIHGLKDGTGAVVPGDCCIRTGMFQMGASSGAPIVFTPELTNLSGLASVTVSFTVSSMWEKGAIKEAGSADFQQLGVYTATGGSVDKSKSTKYATLSDATVKSVAVLPRPATDVKTPTWETKTVTINNVAPGTRIGIGAVRPDGKTGNQRFLLREVVVKVASYGIPKLTTPVLKSQEISKVKASFTFETQEMAQTYRLGYKKNGDADYKYIEQETPEFNLTGLSVNTLYIIKVVAVAGEYESETPYYQEFRTESVDYKYPMSISDSETFVEWMTYGAEFTSPSDVITLDADLDLNDVEVPVVAEFGGVLNGNGKSIKNWTSNHALFNKVNGTIKDLTIDASCVFTASSVFAPVTLNNAGTISNVHNKANVTYSAGDFSESVIIAGIAAESTGSILNCSNAAAISATTAGQIKGAGVAGIAGYLAGSMSDCSNTGAVTVSAKYIAGKSSVTGKSILACVGGLAGVGGTGFEIKNSNNNGKVTFTLSGMESATATQERICVGGIAGAPDGDIVKSNNYGEVYAKLATSTGVESPVNNIAVVGGISGGDYFATGQASTNITDCVNEGKITLYNDSAKANSALGGIVGWPGIEGAQATYTKNCVNKGTITFTGNGKCRVGGVQGGTGNMEGCTNEGAVVFESGNNTSVIGSLCGFHSQGHVIKNCNALGTVTAKSTVDGMGGLIGNIGNATHQTGEGCVVKCTLTGGTAATSGMIIGKFNGKTKAITLGTAASPIKVSGSINGTAVTASNVQDCIHGTTNYTASVHVLTAVYGE